MPIISKEPNGMGHRVVTEFVDSVGTSPVTFTLQDTTTPQDTLQIFNIGPFDLIVSVGTQTNITVPSYRGVTFTESYTAFTIKSSFGIEGFRASCSYEVADETDEQDFFNKVNAQLADIATNVKSFGAKGDGTDDSPAFTSANTAHPNIVVANGTFRISQNITIGSVTFLNGGSISIDGGVTVTVDCISCEPSTICIKGAGKLVIKNNRFSLGWYEGAYANLKWDFMRRGFSQGVQKYVHVPLPKANDPACTNALEFPYAWAVNGAMNFNDPENMLIFDSEAPFVAVSPCTDMFVFSTLQKTEEITFPKGLWVEGGNTRTTPIANNGIVIHGGARIKFMGATRCKTFLQYGVLFDNLYFGNDEIQFDFLEVTGFGASGVYLKGNTNGNVNTKIGYIFSNGALAGSESFIKIEGKVRDVSIDKLNENINTGAGYTDVSTAGILVNSNVDGSPQSVIINDAFMTFSTKSVVKTQNNGGSSKINQVTIRDVFSNNSTTLLNLSYLTNTRISSIQNVANSISIASDCSNLDITADTTAITGNCPMLRLNGKYYAKYVMVTDSVITLTFPTGTGTGETDIICVEDAGSFASLFLRNSGAIISKYSGANVNLTTGVLAGTTGLTAKLNVSFNGNILYLENRTGSSRTITVYVNM